MLVQEMFKEQIHYNHGTWSDISILPMIKMHVKICLCRPAGIFKWLHKI